MLKKFRFRRPFNMKHGKGGLNTGKIWTTSPLPYLLITLKAIVLEKIRLTDMKFIKNVC